MGKVLVVGAGTMGKGIAQVCAENGWEVFLADVDSAILQRSLADIGLLVRKRAAKGELPTADVDGILGRIHIVAIEQAPADIAVAVEAAREDLPTKQSLFALLDGRFGPATILGTNTSALSITEIAGKTQHPERVVGIHFCNPVQRMKLVEIVSGRDTAVGTVAAARAFAESLGKTPVEVRESPGFILNRLLIPMINEAIVLYGSGVAEREAIDTSMQLGAAHPMGPLALADLIGLDVCLYIMDTLARELGDVKYRPAPLLRQMVAEGKLGRKTSQGFYSYAEKVQ